MVSSGEKAGPTPANISTPTTATATKLAALFREKNATLRRAMSSGAMPSLRSAHAPRASPPAPLAGSSEPTASSDIPSSYDVRHDMCVQKMGPNMST